MKILEENHPVNIAEARKKWTEYRKKVFSALNLNQNDKIQTYGKNNINISVSFPVLISQYNFPESLL